MVVGILWTVKNDVYAIDRFEVNYQKSSVKVKTVKHSIHGIQIRWNPVGKSVGYLIYRRENNGRWKTWDKVKGQTTYTDEYTETGTQYQYAIKAFTYYKGKTLYGKLLENKTVITGIPKSIEGVTAKYKGTDEVVVKWNKNIEVSGYYIYRRVNQKIWKKVASINNPKKSSYTDSLPEKGVMYYYKVIPFEIVDDVEYIGYRSVEPVRACSATGIDVSYHNGKISWSKVKAAGIDFAFIRAGYGDSRKKSGGVVDNQFARNVKYARKNGIDIGVYLYSCATSVDAAKREAKFLVNLLKDYGTFEYPIVYDFESTYRKAYKYKSENTKMIQAFCKIIEDAGYDAMIYSDYNMLTKYVDYDKVSKYGIWMAYWTFDPEKYPVNLDNVQFWQYSDRGRIDGISEAVDRNVRFIN